MFIYIDVLVLTISLQMIKLSILIQMIKLDLNLRNPGRGFESRRRQNLVVKAYISRSFQALAGIYSSTKMSTALPVITEC